MLPTKKFASKKFVNKIFMIKWKKKNFVTV